MGIRVRVASGTLCHRRAAPCSSAALDQLRHGDTRATHSPLGYGARVPNEIQYVDIKANGLRFNVATCGEGSRLALFLHGFPELAYSWRFQQPAVAALGYRTWAPDLRGYGGSDRPYALSDYAIEALLADVAGSHFEALVPPRRYARATDVGMLYRLILGREPESELEAAVSAGQPFEAIAVTMMRSTAFDYEVFAQITG